ncbi:hypothetical protein D3C80_861100 [compost metagenome]
MPLLIFIDDKLWLIQGGGISPGKKAVIAITARFYIAMFQEANVTFQRMERNHFVVFSMQLNDECSRVVTRVEYVGYAAIINQT